MGSLRIVLIVAWMISGSASMAAAGPWQANGFKVGEVSATTAVVWTRLTKNQDRIDRPGVEPLIYYRNSKTGKLLLKPDDGREDWIVENVDNSVANKDTVYTPVPKYPDGESPETVDGAIPGAPGQVRVRYLAKGSDQWQQTEWVTVGSEQDYTHSFRLKHLAPGTRYQVNVESRLEDGHNGATLTGEFGTAPAAGDAEPVSFVVSTCQAYIHQDSREGGFKIYREMEKLHPDFFVQCGDFVYFDRMGKSLDLARWHFHRMFSLPFIRQFHQVVPCYYMKDDHDTWMDDCYPQMESVFMGTFTFEQGKQLFREQLPMSELPYRTFRWGKDLQIWLVEGREFRSNNKDPDGPNKTIWGPEQMAWFKKSVSESDATFKILMSPTPIVGPDRDNKFDNHSNINWKHEGDIVRSFIAEQKNMFIVCGDRHWQFASEDLETGIREFSCGPASDEHAGGWTNDEVRAEHHYLNVTGGFLGGFVEHQDGKPTLTFRYYDVAGKPLYQETFNAK